MPELPEVETTLKVVSPYVKNSMVFDVDVYQPKLRWPVSNGVKNKFVGSTIDAVWRRAKYLIFEQQDGACMLHLGMSGKMRVVPKGSAPILHDHVVFHIGDIQLHFNDPRRFGSVLWVEKPILQHKLLNHLGPEPLGEGFCGEVLYAKTRNKKTLIKSWVMNAKNIVGVGNIYASEALFMANISPFRPAGELTYDESKKLALCIKKVLEAAIKVGGTTLKDFRSPDAKIGYFHQQLLVYGKVGQKCTVCLSKIQQSVIAQRSSFYCMSCQI